MGPHEGCVRGKLVYYESRPPVPPRTREGGSQWCLITLTADLANASLWALSVSCLSVTSYTSQSGGRRRGVLGRAPVQCVARPKRRGLCSVLGGVKTVKKRARTLSETTEYGLPTAAARARGPRPPSRANYGLRRTPHTSRVHDI